MTEIPSTRETMREFLGPQVLSRLLRHPKESLPNGSIETVTCMVVHLHGMYGAFDDPQKEADFLSRYSDIAFPIIHKYDGVIADVASHDSTLAYFGQPRLESEHELQAVSAAIELREGLKTLIYIQTTPNIGMGIGINTGQVFYGDVGGAGRINYGAYGDPVRLAHLIAEATHINDILIGESTYLQVKERIQTRSLVEINTPSNKSTLIAHRVVDLQGQVST